MDELKCKHRTWHFFDTEVKLYSLPAEEDRNFPETQRQKEDVTRQ